MLDPVRRRELRRGAHGVHPRPVRHARDPACARRVSAGPPARGSHRRRLPVSRGSGRLANAALRAAPRPLPGHARLPPDPPGPRARGSWLRAGTREDGPALGSPCRGLAEHPRGQVEASQVPRPSDRPRQGDERVAGTAAEFEDALAGLSMEEVQADRLGPSLERLLQETVPATGAVVPVSRLDSGPGYRAESLRPVAGPVALGPI